MNSDRRAFFKTLGTAAAAAAVTVPGINHEAAAAVLPTDGRAFTVKRSLLEIEGQPTGDLNAVNGGYPIGIVVEEGVDEGGVMRKRIAGSNVKDLVLSGGGNMGPKFFELITKFLALESQTFSGNISYSDAKFREGGRLEFQDALVKSVRFPTLDASAKTAGAFDITCKVGSSQRTKGDLSKGDIGTKSKAFLVSNFRVSIDGLESTMALTSRVEGFTVQQEILPPTAVPPVLEIPSEGQGVSFPVVLPPQWVEGEWTTFQETPTPSRAGAFVDVGPLQIPDLVMTVSETRSEALYDWFEKSVVQGVPDERNGKIELLSADFKTVLFTIELFNLGLWWLATEDGDESVLRRVTAKMFCERMSFKQG